VLYVLNAESQHALTCCARAPARSTLAAEVEAPGRTFPRALAGAVVLVVAMYVLPLAACLGVMPAAADWRLGFFATVAGEVGGSWLSWALVAAAAVSQARARRPPARRPPVAAGPAAARPLGRDYVSRTQ